MQDQPTGRSFVDEPVWRERLRAWFTEPPYPGPLAIGAFAVGFLGLALLPNPAPPVDQRSSSERQVAMAPAPEQPPQPLASVEIGDKPSPQVSVRTLEEQGNAPANGPLGGVPPGSVPPGNMPGNWPVEPAPSTLPTVPEPGLPGPADVPSPTTLPEPAPQPSVPAPEPPVVQPAPRIEPEPEPERPRPRRPRAVPVPARETGRMTIYFDADSTTFDRGGDRLPLRVQIYVNGVKRLETDDPEKREFEIEGLPPGEHDVQIVPYVGNAPADPRREIVRIRPRRPNEFKAVLRRSDGTSRISKFEER